MEKYIFLILISLITSKTLEPKIEIYIESLCDDCMRFIKYSYNEYLKFNYPLADVRLIPYGNAHEKYNKEKEEYQFSCQHGENECYGNLMYTCIINELKDNEIIICVNKYIFRHRLNFDRTFYQCVNKNKTIANKIFDCIDTKKGNLFQHEMALRTKKHDSVPWVVINDEHDYYAQGRIIKNLTDYLCGLPHNDCSKHSFLGFTPYEKLGYDICKNLDYENYLK